MTDKQFKQFLAVNIAQLAVNHGILAALRKITHDPETTAVDWQSTLTLLNQAQTIHTEPRQGVRKERG